MVEICLMKWNRIAIFIYNLAIEAFQGYVTLGKGDVEVVFVCNLSWFENERRREKGLGLYSGGSQGLCIVEE
jgi:hypothetical protein